MIVKITTGSDFKGAEIYDTGRSSPGKIAEVLDSEGIDMDYDDNEKCTPVTEKIVASFNMQAGLNPRVRKPVKHFVLTWPPEDLPKLTNGKIIEIVRRYLREMGYADTQFMITRHYEKDNPHVHVIVNMVNNFGQRISDKNEFRRNIDVCKVITNEYGFTWGRHKWAHKCDIPCDCRNRAYESARYDISRAVVQAMARIDDIGQLPQRLILDGSGVIATLKRDNNGNPVGISFSKTVTIEGGRPLTCKLSGTSIDRRFTCRNLMRVLEIKEDMPRIAEQAMQALELFATANDVGYEMPRKVRRQQEKLNDEIRRYYHDQKRYESLFKGDCVKAAVLISLALAYATPLLALSTALTSAIIIGIRCGQYGHAESELEEAHEKLNNLIRIFSPEEPDVKTTKQSISKNEDINNNTRKSYGGPKY